MNMLDDKLPLTKGLALCRRTVTQFSTVKHVASVVSAWRISPNNKT